MTQTTAARPRVFSGMQPTADSLHLGNLLGALTQWVVLQESYDCTFAVVDLHAITVQQDPAVLRHRTRATAAQYLAAGVDPVASTLFVQSHVSAHAELAWAMICLTGFGEASRMTQFKDKSSRASDDQVSAGLFAYPMLQVADILLHDANAVPVGEDQRQHLELTRDLAQRFNTRYGKTFVIPEPYIIKGKAKILDLALPEKQMSKSIGGNGVLFLLDELAVNLKKIRGAVTDSESIVRFDPIAKPGVSNLLTILSALTDRNVETVVDEFSTGGYGDLKKATADAFAAYVEPLQAEVARYLDDPAQLDAILAAGAVRAREQADARLADAFSRMGFLPRRA